jgi:hypothetical protein
VATTLLPDGRKFFKITQKTGWKEKKVGREKFAAVLAPNLAKNGRKPTGKIFAEKHVFLQYISFSNQFSPEDSLKCNYKKGFFALTLRIL